MTDSYKKIDADILKLTAVVAMLTDYIGAFLYPQISLLRIIGRIAFPVFAFFVAEGCIYTKNRTKYLLRFFVFAVLTQIVKCIFGDNDDMNILFTFAVSVVVIFLFQELIKSIKDTDSKKTVYLSMVSVALVLLILSVNSVVKMQYGFWGCLTPAAIYMSEYIDAKKYTGQQIKLIMLAVMLTLIYFDYGGVQSYAYLALPLLVLYSGKKGDRVPKYFFWLFYPAHLAAIYIVRILIQ